jgi:AcrR family transcriptional regulator
VSPKPDVSEQRKAEIIGAAMRVFSKKGFSGARMDDIVEESHLSKGLLYWYFKSKDALIAAIMNRLFAPEMERIRDLAAGGGSARARLRTLAEESVKEIAGMLKLIPITFEFYSLAFRNKVVKKAFQEYFELFYQNITSVVEQGIERGEFRDQDPRTAAVALGSILEGSLLLWVFSPKSVDLAEQIRSGIDTFVRGMERSRGAEHKTSTTSRNE